VILPLPESSIFPEMEAVPPSPERKRYPYGTDAEDIPDSGDFFNSTKPSATNCSNIVVKEQSAVIPLPTSNLVTYMNLLWAIIMHISLLCFIIHYIFGSYVILAHLFSSAIRVPLI
jgi:hypothetical protein